MTTQTNDAREASALAAYNAVYQGPSGLKASSEDALVNVLTALYPDDFPAFDAASIYKLRANDSLRKVTDQLCNDECEGLDSPEIIARLLPRLDEAMAA